MDKLRKNHRGTAGFTLIELLVVVLIIGILAAIAVPQYFAVVEKGHFAEATGCMDVIKGAEARVVLNGAYQSLASVAAPGTTLDTGCAGLKYFSGTVASAGASSYTVKLERNASNFSTTSGLSANYTVTLTHVDGSQDSYDGSGVPNSYLPQ